MISTQPRRQAYSAAPPFHPAPNAALLIDFDNVTMGIRSDLGKELKALLNSDVIRGKVAVQRAYADWRRYPQYIVPLAESSIDLIFAPAYGSSKKNATDLRMAIDAMELVFTRPEIGTFILLTGDSDFSSCVLKLKEYGKYVIGVGMRESSSDLLIQNCDEYYSYHSLSGLTRAGEDEGMREDPWQLVQQAARQMAASGDPMRTDRLKQVMLDIDPGFDEKKLGYSKFSRFVSEAAGKGMIRLRKMESGQYEITVDSEDGPQPAAPRAEAPEAPRDRTRDRRGRGRSRRDTPAAEPARAAPAPIEQAAEPAAAPAASGTADEGTAAADAPVPGIAADLQSAYGLLQQAVRGMAGSNGGGVRDGDVKRKMLELAPDFDETTLGFPKFSRFLRQAHDAEVIDLNRVGTGHYEVSLTDRGPRLPEPAALAGTPPASVPPGKSAPVAASRTEASAATDAIVETPRAAEAPVPSAPESAPSAPSALGALRGRRGGRGAPAEGPPPLLPGQVIRAPAVAAPAPEPAATSPDVAQPQQAEAAAEEEVAATQAAEGPSAPAASRSRRGRRGGRGRSAAQTPPPVLPGQVVAAPEAEELTPPAQEAAAAADESAAVAEPAPEEAPKKRGRSRTRKPKAEPAAQAEPEAPQPAPEPAFSPADLGLPRNADAIQAYLTNRYRGIGAKTAESLLQAFGTDVFQTMQEEPERVRELLGERRANGLLEQWSADYGRRTESGAAGGETAGGDEAAAPSAVSDADAAEPQAEGDSETGGARSRARRGGRGRGRAKKDQPAPA